jgi:hypothetical protein
MQRVSKDSLLAPNICIVCEERPDGDAVDTLRTGTFGGGSPYNGRKYVCWRCVEEFAKLFNFEKGDDVEQAKVDKAHADATVEVIKGRVKEFADALVEFASHPGASVEVGPVSKVSNVPAAPKASVKDVKAVAKPVKQKAPAVTEG